MLMPMSGYKNWDKINDEVLEAEKVINLINNNIDILSESSNDSNRLYVAFQELKNSLKLQEDRIFYIKYRNVIHEIDSILM